MADYQCTRCDAFEIVERFTPDACSICGGTLALQETLDTNLRFDFVSTPHNAWLLVHRTTFEHLGLSIDALSSTSRLSPAGTLALAEEPDAIRFMDFWQSRYGPVPINEHPFGTNVIADWPALSAPPPTLHKGRSPSPSRKPCNGETPC